MLINKTKLFFTPRIALNVQKPSVSYSMQNNTKYFKCATAPYNPEMHSAPKTINFPYNKRYFARKQNDHEVFVEDNEINNQSTENKADWYYPDEKLKFDKEGYCLICTFDSFNVFRFTNVVTALFFFFIFQLGLRKTIDITSRGQIGFFWYIGLGSLGFWGQKKNYGFAKQFIGKIRLNKNGTDVQIQTPIHPFGTINCKISEVKKPTKIDESIFNNSKVMLALSTSDSKMFPVIIKDEIMLLPKEMEFAHQDVFRAIFNSQNIITTGDGDEIII